ncbi:MAG: hypothetical protein JNK70_14845, partial [Phycisphaerae bacterium]|nr:hypothetical protein [Phycisphaerae bacterium]
GWTDIEPADMVFATIWYSARVVRDLGFSCIRCYFVQDYEALFHPMGSAHVMAENSYRYGLHHISIGRWLPARLSERFNVGAASTSVPISICTVRLICHETCRLPCALSTSRRSPGVARNWASRRWESSNIVRRRHPSSFTARRRQATSGSNTRTAACSASNNATRSTTAAA